MVNMRRASTRSSKSVESAADVASGVEVAADTAVKRKRARQPKKGPKSTADRHAELDEHVSCNVMCVLEGGGAAISYTHGMSCCIQGSPRIVYFLHVVLVWLVLPDEGPFPLKLDASIWCLLQYLVYRGTYPRAALSLSHTK